MRFLFLFLWGWSQLAWSAEALTPTRIEPRAIQIRNTGTPDVALLCPRKGPTSVRPLASPPMPTEIPDEDEVASAVEDARVAGGSQPARPAAAWPSNPHGWRIAVWGDSHMAAAFFSDQLQRKLAPADAAVSSRFVHAGVGHGGVRGLVRNSELLVAATSFGGIHTSVDRRARHGDAVPEGFARISAGIEDTDDLISDIVGSLSSL